MSRIWYHADRHEQWKGVMYVAICFCSGPRTGARGQNVPPPITALQKGQEWSGVSVRRNRFFFFFVFLFNGADFAGPPEARL